MFGAVEQPGHWARHLVRTRALQKETGGFTEFVPLPFVHMAAPIYLQRKSRRGPTFREAVLMHAVGRIAYHGLDRQHPGVVGEDRRAGVQQLLQAGVNDLGGTLMDENISAGGRRSARPGMDEAGFRAIGRAARPHARAAHDALRSGRTGRGLSPVPTDRTEHRCPLAAHRPRPANPGSTR